jgi:hypothetical protein
MRDRTMATSTTPTTPLEDVVYPESDGKPMGETGFHVKAMILLHDLLKDLLAGRLDVYIAVDLFLYYERGNPRAVKAPDVMVILGVGNHERRTFKTWEEQAVPTVIFEVSSDGWSTGSRPRASGRRSSSRSWSSWTGRSRRRQPQERVDVAGLVGGGEGRSCRSCWVRSELRHVPRPG